MTSLFLNKAMTARNLMNMYTCTALGVIRSPPLPLSTRARVGLSIRAVICYIGFGEKALPHFGSLMKPPYFDTWFSTLLIIINSRSREVLDAETRYKYTKFITRVHVHVIFFLHFVSGFCAHDYVQEK